MSGTATMHTARLAPSRIAYTVFLGALSALPPLLIDMGLPGIPAIEASFPGAADRGALTLNLFIYAFAFAAMFSFIASAPAVMMGRMGLSPSIFTLVFARNSCGRLVGSLEPCPLR